MKRTTIILPPDLKHRAKHLAREEGISLGELIRQSLEARLSREAVSRVLLVIRLFLRVTFLAIYPRITTSTFDSGALRVVRPDAPSQHSASFYL